MTTEVIESPELVIERTLGPEYYLYHTVYDDGPPPGRILVFHKTPVKRRFLFWTWMGSKNKNVACWQGNELFLFDHTLSSLMQNTNVFEKIILV